MWLILELSCKGSIKCRVGGLKGCFETQGAPEELDISNETNPTFTCYLFCASFRIYLTMGISRKTCYCYDDVQKYRLPNEQCRYETFPDNPDELYGAPNSGSVIVFTYHQQRPVSDTNDFGNCASLRYLGVFPVKHYYSSCLNRIGIFCTNGQTSGSAQLSWTEAVKQCGTMKTDLNGYYTGLTDSVKYYPLWTGFYRRSIEQWTPPKIQTYNDVNLHSFHCVAVKVNDDGTLFQISYPQLCTRTLPSICEKSTRVDGNWASWGTWSKCPVTCGGGIEQRERTCTNPPPKHGGSNCVGDASETRPCNTQPCPVDGSWSRWTSWSKCSNVCGNGRQIRSRSCDNPAPDHGGTNCEGSSFEQRECIGCPANKNVTNWSAWGSCSVTCGTGTSRRNRSCGLTTEESEKHNCWFSETETRTCILNPCPVDGSWTAWSDWSDCSNICGTGQQSKTRTCTNPKPEHGGKLCEGDSTDQRTCVGCPANKKVTEWSSWSTCSTTCGPGNQSRYRKCNLTEEESNEYNCKFHETEGRQCYIRPCPIDGGWTQWSSWGGCSNNCGHGEEIRTKTCDDPKPENGGKPCTGEGSEKRKCIGCPDGKVVTQWSSWGQCSVTCGNGNQSRSRDCDLTSTEADKYQCYFSDEENKLCIKPGCPIDGGWSQWSSWGGCSNNCGHGEEIRTRTCDDPKPENGGKPCTGEGSEKRKCIGCPDGKMVTQWSSWGQCSVTCGNGNQSRSRDCDLTSTEADKYQCYFRDEENKLCIKPGCPIDGGWSQWSSWGGCSNNCGHGEEIRTKTCDDPKPENGGKPCTGEGSEKRKCIGCPDGKVVTQWSSWGQCSVTCGNGNQSRSRDCDLTSTEADKYQCYFRDDENKLCIKPGCPIDGGWSQWSSWGGCSNNCGHGEEIRTRTCDDPKPENGGKSCTGEGSEKRKCIGCPDGKVVTQWSSWGQCSVTCGNGNQSRSRDCDLTSTEADKYQCYFRDEEKKLCIKPGCPNDGGWSQWSSWGGCSNNCGHGEEIRTRTCDDPKPENGGKPCTGEGSEKRKCIGCPDGKVVTQWSSWGQCSVTCGNGNQSRSRDCDLTSTEADKYQCYFRDDEKKLCIKPGCPIDGGWSQWSSWGGCSNNCGHGEEIRTKTCDDPKPENGGKPCTGEGSEKRKCIGCPDGKVVTQWSSWGQCSVTCGNGNQSRSRDCDLTSTEADKYQCYFRDDEKKLCIKPGCPNDGGWSQWSSWGGCSNNCGHGEEIRTRTCDDPKPENGGRPCTGEGSEKRKCIGCPDGNVVTQWSSWGQCSVTCGNGNQLRFRDCGLTSTEADKYRCYFRDEENKLCIKPECPANCVKDCRNMANGDYQSCWTCRGFIKCAHGTLYNMSCPGVLVWDDNAKQCLYTSTTCSLSTIFSSGLSRIKRSDEEGRHLSLKNEKSRGYELRGWTVLMFSVLGGVSLVALLAVAMNLFLKKRKRTHDDGENRIEAPVGNRRCSLPSSM
ncbi:SCO-spondin-like isoform X2 [Ostrea edulis]|uniref:SCO-spondin-like isoform X2 n=1 Tax=Ostrea edulis TaxID=37623 RepID=UPI0024AECF30|nr:SCO-spondin-like isoform X2 [Ostrea edulis]